MSQITICFYCYS